MGGTKNEVRIWVEPPQAFKSHNSFIIQADHCKGRALGTQKPNGHPFRVHIAPAKISHFAHPQACICEYQ
jgi:hypothetical protein